jgi:FkbM family methyltransferase
MKDKKPGADFFYLLNVVNIFSPLISAKDDLNGFEFKAYKGDVIGRVIYKTGYWEKNLSQWILNRFGEAGSNFIDVGANLGYYTCLFSKLAGSQGRVLSVEPEPMNLNLLNINTARNCLQNYKILPVALGEVEGEVTLNVYKSSNRGRHSIIMPGSGDSVEVPVTTLDAAVSDFFGNEKISLIKIDVEGYEPYVLRGGAETIDRVDCLVIEYVPRMLIASGVKVTDLFGPLFEKFSKAYAVSEDGISPVQLNQLLHQTEPVDLIFDR